MRSRADDLRAATKLAVEATKGVTSVVEQMHVAIASGPAVLGSPLRAPVSVVTGLVYGAIRGTTALVGAAIDAALAQLAPLLGEGEANEALLGALNGVVGDYLAAHGNPLALPMRLHRRAPGGRALVLVHGLCGSPAAWVRAGHDHGEALAKDLGFAPVYAHYNSGLHISENGRALAAALDALDADEITLIGHSMGGLVARSAIAHGGAWTEKLRGFVALGSPHHGAPLERGGTWIELLLGVSKYSAPLRGLARLRSAGITDLRFGAVRDEDWDHAFVDGRAPLALPDVRCFALAGSLKNGGDGLVPVASALGQHADAAHALRFHATAVAEVNHLDLLGAAVYPTLRDWLA